MSDSTPAAPNLFPLQFGTAQNPPPSNVSNYELLIGAAGEHLVCSDLLSRGIVAGMTGLPGPWDVIAETPTRMIRIQVKTTQAPRRFPRGSNGHLTGYIW